MKIMVSACLAGENCKYNGGNNRNEKVLRMMEEHEVITVCPEQMGGLPTPRIPSEVRGGVVTMRDGSVVDREFRLGAERCLEIARRENPDLIVLQSRSPSCGVKQRYDGTFSGTLVDEPGVTAQLLMENGFRVVDIEDLRDGDWETAASGTGSTDSSDTFPHMNCIVVFNRKKDAVLFCRRRKDPFKGRLNFVGGKVEPGESSRSAAYRELYEETGISPEQIRIFRFMDLTYYHQRFVLELYAGILGQDDVQLREEKNPLLWLPLTEDFTDRERFAGEQNIAHIINIARMYPLPEVSQS